jgi:quercetin dioxygenase-like cupin family protein
VIRKDALGGDPNPTPGMQRAHAISVPGLTSGTVSVGPGVRSGWHHHGTHETSIHVLKGALRMEFAGGAFEAKEGDFIHVPAGAVHRESNPGSEPNLAVFSRAGTGAVTINVEAPPKP